MGCTGLLHPRGKRAWVVRHQHTFADHFPALLAAAGIMSLVQDVP